VSRWAAALGSLVFFVIAPGVVSGWLPWVITGWRVTEGLPGWWPAVAVVGWLLVAAGVFALVAGFARFVTEGRGTPAPVAPPAILVTGGLFAWVRNPMYLANIVVVLGQAAVFGSLSLLAYAVAAALCMFGFVKLHEEPALASAFGEQYADYRRRVPGWWPRVPRR
jgi:protein-S-isoprenylcysteine O-methyltransferase Ste14